MMLLIIYTIMITLTEFNSSVLPFMACFLIGLEDTAQQLSDTLASKKQNVLFHYFSLITN